MRGKRLVSYQIETNYNDKQYDFIYRRNFFGFRMNDNIEPININVIFEGGSTGDEVGLPERLTIVGNLNKFLNKDDIKILVANASLNGKSTRGYINDFEYWFPKLPDFNPSVAIFYSGINDSVVDKILIENKTFEDTYKYKIISYIFNNSFALNKIKEIKDKYFDLEREKIIYDFDNKDLYKNFKLVNFKDAKTLYSTLDLDKRDNEILEFYKKNLFSLKTIIEKNGIIPVFVTQVMYNGVSTKALYLVNEETKKFAKANYYHIIKLDELFEPQEGDFYDQVHTTPQGSLKIAQIIYVKLKNIMLSLL